MKTPRPTKHNFWRAFYLQALPLTILALVAFHLIDFLYPEVTIAPLAGTVLVFGLSLLFPPAVLAACIVPIAVFVYLSLIFVPSFDPTKTESIVRLCIRLGTFSIAAGLGLMVCSFRCRLVQMLNQSRELMSFLPVPIIFSNAAGRIVWVNESARQILGTISPEGRLYTDVLPSDGTPLAYPLLFSNPQAEQFLSPLLPDYNVHLLRFRTGTESLLVTTFLSKRVPTQNS